MVHSATGMTPKEARKPTNTFKVKLNLSSKARRNRIYPEVDKGDDVKIFRKRKPNEKERVGNWSQDVYTTESIDKRVGQDCYYA